MDQKFGFTVSDYLPEETQELKIAVVGEPCVGKTSVIHRFLSSMNLCFCEAHSAMAFQDFHEIKIQINYIPVQLKVLETCGFQTEDFRTAAMMVHCRQADGVLLLFNVTDVRTFLKFPTWLNKIRLENKEAEIIAVGNKNEDPCKKEELVSVVEELVGNENLEYIEINAKSGENVQLVFHRLAKKILMARGLLSCTSIKPVKVCNMLAKGKQSIPEDPPLDCDIQTESKLLMPDSPENCNIPVECKPFVPNESLDILDKTIVEHQQFMPEQSILDSCVESFYNAIAVDIPLLTSDSPKECDVPAKGKQYILNDTFNTCDITEDEKPYCPPEVLCDLVKSALTVSEDPIKECNTTAEGESLITKGPLEVCGISVEGQLSTPKYLCICKYITEDKRSTSENSALMSECSEYTENKKDLNNEEMSDPLESKQSTSKNGISKNMDNNGITEELFYMLNTGQQTDLQFAVSNSSKSEAVTFSAHKLVLSVWSPHFADMFKEKVIEKSNTIPIQDTDPKAFEDMIRFMYGCYPALKTCKEAFEIYKVSKKFLVKHLIDLTIKHIKEIIPDVSNVLEILEASMIINIEFLRKCCLKLIQQRTAEVFASNDVSQVSMSVVNEILNLKTLSLTSEYDLLEWIFKWAKFQCDPNNSNVRKVLEEFLPRLHFASLSCQDFANFFLNHSSFFTADEAFSILMHISDQNSMPLPKWQNSKINFRIYNGE